MHALFGPSSASRWAKCPGSLLGDVGEGGESIHAATGTQAHRLLEAKLKGEVVTAEEVSLLKDDDYASVEMAYTYVMSQKFDWIMTEQKVYGNYKYVEHYGTLDIVGGKVHERTIHLMDYKNGAGVFVPVGDNAQLLTYDGLFLGDYPEYESWGVINHILQPKRWNLSSSPAYPDDIAAQETANLIGMNRVLRGDTTEVPGDHCRFCPRRGKTCIASIGYHLETRKSL